MSGTVLRSNKPRFKMMPNKMAVDFDMLGPLMEHGISRDMYSRLVIAPKKDWQMQGNPQISKQVGYPESFTYCGCHLLYSTSAEEREMVAYFLLFQEIKFFPRKRQYPVIDLRVLEHLAQSVSEYAISLEFESAE